MYTTVAVPSHKFVDVAELDESQYPAYRVDLTAKEIYDLVSALPMPVIDIDPNYQRGIVVGKSKSVNKLIHEKTRNKGHIDSIYDDLTAINANGRTRAIIPPIWVNARRSPTRGSHLAYNKESKELLLIGNTAVLYVFDGWHRTMAVCKAIRDQAIDPNRRFTFYIFDAPVEFEAQAFRTLNYAALPVDRVRVAWVSSPFTLDIFQITREFVENVPDLKEQLEVTLPRLSGTSTKLCSFQALINGMLSDPTGKRWTQVDAKNPYERRFVVDYLTEYWNHLVAVRPEFGVVSPAQRKADRESVPVLMNRVAVQVLLALAYSYLECYKPLVTSNAGSEVGKLKDLSAAKGYDLLFASLRKLATTVTAADGSQVDFFSLANPIWAPYMTPTGRFSLTGYTARDEMFKILKNLLGLGSHNSISVKLPSVMPAGRNDRIAARQLGKNALTLHAPKKRSKAVSTSNAG